MAEPIYTDADAVRAELAVDDAVLSDDVADALILDAEDLVDDQLGNWIVDFETGRKIVPENHVEWRVEKLARATAKTAAFLFKNPDWGIQQRYSNTAGDISVSTPFGSVVPAAAVLLNASGLRRLTARASASSGGRSNDSVIGNLPEPD